MKIDLDQYLCFLIENHGSDLHLKSGSRVHYRKDGDLLSLDTEVCTVEDIENVAKSILSEKISISFIQPKRIAASLRCYRS